MCRNEVLLQLLGICHQDNVPFIFLVIWYQIHDTNEQSVLIPEATACSLISARHLEYLMLCWDLIVRHPAAHVTQQREANSWQKHRFLVNKCSSKHHRSLGWHVWKHNIKSSLEFGSGEELVSPAFRNRWCDKWGQGRDQLVHVNKASTLCSWRLIVRKKVITVRKKNRPTCLHPLPQVSA